MSAVYVHSTQHVANRCKSKWGLAALEQSGFFLFLLLLLLSPDSKRTGRPLMVNSDTFWFAWSKTWREKAVCLWMNLDKDYLEWDSCSWVEETGAGTGRRISVTSPIILKRELSVNVMLLMFLVDLISFPSWPWAVGNDQKNKHYRDKQQRWASCETIKEGLRVEPILLLIRCLVSAL